MKRLFQRSLLLPVFLVFFIFPVPAQQSDFQVWPSIQVGVEVLNDLKLQVEEEVRFHENSTMIERQINNMGISYRINKYVKTTLTYRIEADWKNADTYSWRQGLYADFTFRYEPGRFLLDYRVRFQSAKIDMNEKEEQLFDGLKNRHKVGVEYDIKNIPLVPFVEGEIFMNSGGNRYSGVTAYRTWFGMKYNLNKRHEVTLKYGIDQEVNVADPLRAYIVAIGYSADLKLKSLKK
ncbi:MAG TPA: DUF2490 domain-containing protein [Bacteroidales bacterium]|nr:DUF2490 domain-containing protein [Bacteroidales bacterium]